MVSSSTGSVGRDASMRSADVQGRFRQLVEKITAAREADERPPVQLKPFITISRQVAAGGAEIATRLGERLGWAVYDRELVDRLARQLDVSPELLGLMDETRTNWFTETLLNLFNSRLLLQDSYVGMLNRVMLLATCDGRVVIVGRGGHHLLPPGSGLRVRLVAPREARLERLQSREGLDASAAAERLEALDSDRSDFIHRHFRCRPDDPGQYDLVLDTTSFGVDHTVDLMVRALELKGLG